MNKHSWCFPMIPVMLTLVAGAARAQEPDDRWKKSNDRGNRYEGRIEIPVGRPELEVVSFLGHRESYSGRVDLKIKFFLPSAGRVRLQARELEEDVQYFMEAKSQDWQAAAWNEFGPWSTRFVLVPEEVPAGNLAVLARLEGKDGAKTLMPAFLYHSKAPTKVGRYTLHLRPDANLTEIRFRLFSGDKVLKEGKLVERLEAGVAFPLKLEMSGVPAGRLRLRIDGKFRGKPGGPDKSFFIYHQPDFSSGG